MYIMQVRASHQPTLKGVSTVEIKIRRARAGARWRLGYLEACRQEASKLLNNDQYAHVMQLFDELARSGNPRISQTIDVRPIENYYELRDKGGILGKINLRVYFAVIDGDKIILILACLKKEAEDHTPEHVKVRVRNRLRHAMRQLCG